MTHHLKILAFILSVLLCTFFAPLPAFSQSDSYVEQAVRKADGLKLYEERTWEVLLHYAKSYSGSFVSKIDDDRFFLSPAGRTDRKAELEATIRSLFIPPGKDGEHAACRFPARY